MEQKNDLIEFLVNSDALRFGDFTLKSGRKSPYFMNTGRFDDGKKIAVLSSYYADHIAPSDGEFSVIFGPRIKECRSRSAPHSRSRRNTASTRSSPLTGRKQRRTATPECSSVTTSSRAIRSSSSRM